MRARRRGREDAAERGRELLRILGPLITPKDPELALALRLFEEHASLETFDALLAATTMLAGADALVSADRACAGVRGLAYVDLRGPGVDDLIQST